MPLSQPNNSAGALRQVWVGNVHSDRLNHALEALSINISGQPCYVGRPAGRDTLTDDDVAETFKHAGGASGQDSLFDHREMKTSAELSREGYCGLYRMVP